MTDLDCREFVELAAPDDDGDLDDQTLELLRVHRAGCEGCERYARQLEQIVRLVSSRLWGPPAIR